MCSKKTGEEYKMVLVTCYVQGCYRSSEGWFDVRIFMVGFWLIMIMMDRFEP